MSREGTQGVNSQELKPLLLRVGPLFIPLPTGENTWAFGGEYPSMYTCRKMTGMSTVIKLHLCTWMRMCMCGWVGVCEREDSYVFILWLIIMWPNFKSWVYLPNVFLTKNNSEKTYWDWSKLILTIVIPVLFSGKSVIWTPDWTPGANEQCDGIPPAWPDTEPRGTEVPVRSVYPPLLSHYGRRPTHHCDSRH